MTAKYDRSWQAILHPLFQTNVFRELSAFVEKERAVYTVYPPRDLVLNAFQLTHFDHLKVVILGQDPYHGSGQAHGLSFSVPRGIAIPPSLRNIYTELCHDIPGFNYPDHGDLRKWAEQGVLLLNATLTVQAHMAGSHQKKGWEYFTDQIIRSISDKKKGVVFMLWGAYAKEKTALIDANKHLILQAVHPSPLSAYRGFFGCAHFSQANTYLKENHSQTIDWQPSY